MKKKGLLGTAILFTAIVIAVILLVSCQNISLGDADNSPLEYKIGTTDGEKTVSLSLEPGVYYEDKTLTATSLNGLTIRFTTTGQTPDKDSKEYTSPISLEKPTKDDNGGARVYVYRFATFDSDGNRVGDILDASYIFPYLENRFDLKIVSIVTDQRNLYGDDGIFTNYNMKGRESERETTLSLFGYEGEHLYTQPLGMRVNGTGSRVNVQKNLRFFARREYTADKPRFDFPLFEGLLSRNEGLEIEKYDTFLVRGGASNFGNAMLITPATYDIFRGTNVDCAQYEPVCAFINGKYYGLMTLMEDYSPYYFESHYGTPEEEIATINYCVVDYGTDHSRLDWEFDDGNEAEYEEWHRVRRECYANGMGDAQYKTVCDHIDIDNFIDYILIECYLNNWDWPRNNVRVWRYTGIGDGEVGGYDPTAPYGLDGKWRFLPKDLDITLGVIVDSEKGYASDSKTPMFDVLNKDSYANHRLDVMFNSLMSVPEFRDKVINRLSVLMSTNLSKGNVIDIINKLELQTANEMKYHSVAFGESLDYWDSCLGLSRDFAEKRPEIVRITSNSAHGINLKKLTVTVEHGAVKIGEIQTRGGDVYLPTDVSYEVTLIPDEGYGEGSYKTTNVKKTGDKITLSSNAGKLNAEFKAIESPVEPVENGALCINEVGYSSSDAVNGSDWIELYNGTDEDIVLDGYKIICDGDVFKIGRIKIESKGYKVFFASGTNEGGVYLNFKLSEGEILTLSDGEKDIDSLELKVKDNSFHPGRYPDGGELTDMPSSELTPGYANIHKTEFSHGYGETHKNTVVINGWLCDSFFFENDADGNLGISRSKLEGLVENYKEYLHANSEIIKKSPTAVKSAESFLARAKKLYDGGEVIAVREVFGELDDSVLFYVSSLNSYVISKSN